MLIKFNISEVKKRLELTKRVIPIKIANLTQNHFVSHFTNESFESDKWKMPNRKIAGTNEYKYPKLKGLGRRTSKILVRSGALRRATSNSIRNATWQRIELINGLKYAYVQNNGFKDSVSVKQHTRRMNDKEVQVKAHTSKMNIPARPFMKDSLVLRKKQLSLINLEVDKIWK